MYICRNARWTVWLLRLWTLQLAELSLVLLSKWTQGREEPGRWWTKLHGPFFFPSADYLSSCTVSNARSAQWVTVHEMVHWLFMYGEEQFHNPDLLLQKREGAYTGTSHVLLHCTVQVQLHYSILSRGTLHHLLSRNIGLENGNREVGHLFCYYTGTVKTIWLSSRRVCTLYTTGQISRVHFLKSGYII